METQLPRVEIYSDDDLLFEGEVNSEGFFLHCEIFNWKPSVLKKSYKVFASFLEQLKESNIKQVIAVTPNPKFAKLFGGKVINKGYINEILHEVIIWEVVH